MTKWMYRFLNVGLAFFSATPVTQPDKNVLSKVHNASSSLSLGIRALPAFPKFIEPRRDEQPGRVPSFSHT